MNASYEWLRAFVPFDMSPTELRDLLTSRCATVDDLVSFRTRAWRGRSPRRLVAR